MGRIQKRMPLAALVVAAIALFVALGTTAIGAGGGGTKAGAARATGLANVSVLNSATTATVTGPVRVVAPGTQYVGARATCPVNYRVMGGGVISGSTDVRTNINTSEPSGTRSWSVDYNNGSTAAVEIRAVARCIRFK